MESVNLFFCYRSVNSSGINFGQGSGQQVVTSVSEADSYDSLWSIKEGERLEETH